MSCSPFDIRDYFLQELADPQQRQVEAHVKTCPPCREELDRLRISVAALRSIVDEEIPQRIAFVSDKIFEPSPWKRGLAAFWNSGPRLGFASAALLSGALLFSAVTRPAPAPVAPIVSVATPAPAPVVTQAASLSEAEIGRRIQLAVDQAVAASEGRQRLQMASLIKAAESEHKMFLLAADQHEYDQIKERTSRRGPYLPPAEGEPGDPK